MSHNNATPRDGDEQQSYTNRDKLVVAYIADTNSPEDESPLVKLAARASSVAVDRWGIELEADQQAHDNFKDVLEDAVVDTLRYYSDESSHVEGITGLVFEGQPVTSSKLFTAALELTDMIEEKNGYDRNAPGGLIELVDDHDE